MNSQDAYICRYLMQNIRTGCGSDENVRKNDARGFSSILAFAFAFFFPPPFVYGAGVCARASFFFRGSAAAQIHVETLDFQ